MRETELLIVEDDDRIAAVLTDYAEASGYATRRVARGDLVLETLDAKMPDLILLDIMLPGMDGLEVCRRVRERSSVPIIMITARVEEIDRLLGLELGADDYLCKPFSPREVMARVKAVLRRTRGEIGPRDRLVLDDNANAVEHRGQRVELTPTEFGLLAALAARPGRIFSRSQLMDAAYRDFRVVSDRTIDAHVGNVRRKLATLDPDREFIASVYGAGYRFEA
ncbi:MAG: response regulator [Pseudomonadota bacterium]